MSYVITGVACFIFAIYGELYLLNGVHLPAKNKVLYCATIALFAAIFWPAYLILLIADLIQQRMESK